MPFPPAHEEDPSETKQQSNLKEIKQLETIVRNNTSLFDGRFIALPQIEITAKTTQVVTSGKYLMKTNAINAATNIK